MHRMAVAACLAAISFLGGCAGRLERPGIPRVIRDPAPTPHNGAVYTLEDFESDLKAYKTALGDDALRRRNRMAYGVMAEIDYVYRDYETKLFLNRGEFNVASDFVQLGLAAGSTLSHGARTKTILSALLSGVTGTSLSVDKNFFRQQTVQAIISAMQANRDRIKAIILQRLESDDDAYPFQAARSDLIDYFFAGTLPSGLQQVHQQTAAAAEEKQIALTGVQLSDVQSATAVNRAIALAFKSNDFSHLIPFLQAMGYPVTTASSPDTIEQDLRDLGKRTIEPKVRKQYFDEAAKAGLLTPHK